MFNNKILSSNSRFSSVVWNFCSIFLHFLKIEYITFLLLFMIFYEFFFSVVLIPQNVVFRSVVLIPQNFFFIKLHKKYQLNRQYIRFLQNFKKYQRNSRQLTKIWNLSRESLIILQVALNNLSVEYRTPLIIAQCRPIPIKIQALIWNTSRCRSLPINSS